MLYGGVELVDRPDPENIRKLDILPIPILGQMMRYGMRIDKPHFSELEFRMSRRMDELRAEILGEIPPESLDRFLELSGGFGDEEEGSGKSNGGDASDFESDQGGFNVESGQQVAELLYDVLGLQHRGVKIKKTKGGDRLSTGKKSLEQLKREHPVVPLILEYRENAKLLGTYARAMPRKAKLHPKGDDCPLCRRNHYIDEWRVHTQIMTTRTATGRTASKAPNLANIPTRTKLGAEIRAGFIAGEGCVIAQRDFSQIEVRIMADLSGDDNLIRIYQEDGDVHVITAMGTFGISDPAKVDKMLNRAPAKTVTFGVVYGLAAPGLLDAMAVTFATANTPLPSYMDEQWCESFIEKWFNLYPAVRKHLVSEEEKARRYGIVWTRCGRVRRIPEARSYHSWIQSAGVRQACNHSDQGYSADIMKLAMAEVDADLIRLREYDVQSWPLQTIYDELLIECPEDDGETIEAVLGDVMDNVLVDRASGKLCCKVPIKSDGKILTRWTKD